ncbi:hypothetical protein ACHWQZ_G016471 [Mnemiopsis leidyi]
MVIFGDLLERVPGADGQLHPIHTGDQYDQALNKTFVVLFAGFSVLSTLANPVAFCYNRSQRQTIAALLFQMLAVADFLTNSTFPFVIMSTLLSKDVKPIRDDSTLTKELWSIFNITIISISAILTSLLSITRYMKIIKPFIRFRIRPLLIYIGLNTLYLVVVLCRNIILCGPGESYWLRFQQLSWRESGIAWQMPVAIPYLGHCLVSLITSTLTIYHLQRTRNSVVTETRAKCRQSSYAIVLMNLGNTLFLILITSSTVLYITNPMMIYQLLKMNFMKDCFSPCLLSAANPIIFFLCCKDSRDKLWAAIQTSRRRVENVLILRKTIYFSDDSRSTGKNDKRNPAFQELEVPPSSKSDSFRLRPAIPPPPLPQPIPVARLKRGGRFGGVIKNKSFVSSPF